MPHDVEAIERATLDAVAPEQIEALPDWLLPFDTTTLARANSAVPLRHEKIDPHTLHAVAQRYEAQHMDCQFRIADVAGLVDLHHELSRLGYQAKRPTLTQIAKHLDWRPGTAADPAQLSDTPNDAWKSVYFSGEFDPDDSQNRVQALSRSPQAIYGYLCDASGPVAAGTAVISRGWISIHGMRTKTHARGQGLAKRLIGTFFAAAQARGVQRAFLQVEEENRGAMKAYRECGFETAWRYHYWGKAPETAS